MLILEHLILALIPPLVDIILKGRNMDDDTIRQCNIFDDRIKELESRVGYLETNDAASDEKIKTIFTMLTRIETLLERYTQEMKASMKELTLELDTIKQRPAKNWDSLINAIIAAIAGAAVIYFIGGR